MKRLVALVAAGEAATGVLVLADPAIAVGLLFGTGVTGAGVVMSRIAGVCLIALGIVCWPRPASDLRPAARGLFAYSVLAAVVLAAAGIRGGMTGPVLWPAVAVHGILTILLLRALFLEAAGATTSAS